MDDRLVWDIDNEEWVSWDEIAHLDDWELTYYDFSKKPIQPQKNTTNVSNRSKRNSSNTNNSQNKNKLDAMNIRKPHMALHYKSKKLNEIIESRIVGIVPSTIPGNISSLFLEKIWNSITKTNQKDIQELFNVYYYEQWTATVLMAYRILENVLKIHVIWDLKCKNINTIGDAVNKLEEHNYDESLLKKLQKYRENRNNYMHGNNRAGAGEAKELVEDVISITMHIHNIKQ